MLCFFARLNRSVVYYTSSILSHPAPALEKSKIISSIFILKGRDQFNQNFWNFRSKTQWIGSVRPKKFRKNGFTFLGGPLFPVGPVGILVEWIAPLGFQVTLKKSELQMARTFKVSSPSSKRSLKNKFLCKFST